MTEVPFVPNWPAATRAKATAAANGPAKPQMDAPANPAPMAGAHGTMVGAGACIGMAGSPAAPAEPASGDMMP